MVSFQKRILADCLGHTIAVFRAGSCMDRIKDGGKIQEKSIMASFMHDSMQVFEAARVHRRSQTRYPQLQSQNHSISKMAADAISFPQLPTSIDLRHHLNEHSKARHPSPLKEIIKFMGYEGMVSLAGGILIPEI